MSKPKVLVTGANGLLGRELIASLKGEYDIHAVVRQIPDDAEDNVVYHVADLASEWDIGGLPKDINTIFHLAQSSHFRDFPLHAQDVFKVNVDSTARLLQYAQFSGVKRFIYASSGGVYGTGLQEFNENSPIVPHGQLGYYLASKLCSEVLVESYASLMIVGIMRFFFMYGPKQKRSMLIPRLIDNVKEGKSIVLQGKVGLSINPIHVRDAVKSLRKALSLQESITINIAGPYVLSLHDIACMVSDYLGKEPIFEYQDAQPKNLIANIDAMKSILVPPTISLRDSIKEMVG